MIVDELAEGVLSLVRGAEVRDWCVCLRYAYVEVGVGGSRHLGVALVPHEDVHGVSAPLREPTIEGLRDLASSPNPIDKVLGVALINALSSHLISRDKVLGASGDVTEDIPSLLASEGVRSVLVVGNMAPLVRRLRDAGMEVLVTERNPAARWGGAYPDTSVTRLAGLAEAAVITGAALVNDTIDQLLELLPHAFKVLAGPTAGAYPPLLIPKHVDAVASMVVEDAEAVKRVLRLGGGRWDFSRFTRQYIITADPSRKLGTGVRRR